MNGGTMNSDWAVVTVVTRNYLHFARALAESVRELHPTARVIACLVDPLPEGTPLPEGLEILWFDELPLTDHRRFLFQYSPFELTCALKSFALDHVLRCTDLEKLLYLDGDIQVYSPLDPLLKALDTAKILLTPHLTRPRSITQPDRWEMDVLDTGVFNGGFLGVRRSQAVFDMLTWWKQRMKNLCKWEVNHHDQGWLNALPALFDEVGIERHPGYNGAVWNLDTREFSQPEGKKVLVDGEPLVFFHFASVEPDQDQRLSKVSRQGLSEEPDAVQELFHRYIARLRDCGMAGYSALGYGFSDLEDGTKILPEWRELIRTGHPAFDRVQDPFAVPAEDYRKVVAAVRRKQVWSRVCRGLGFKSM